MGLINQVIDRVFEIQPIKQVRDESIKSALRSYEGLVQETWEQNKQIYEEKIARAYESGFYDGNDDPATSTFKAGGQGYKRISDNYLREGSIDYQVALQTAWELWQKSGIAKRILALKRDHIIGHNAEPTSKNEKALDVITKFWKNNKLGERASKFTMQLFGFGEQCFPAFVRESDGRVLLGYIDPRNIDRVVKHPENSMEDWAIVVKRYSGGVEAGKTAYRIIRKDESYVDDNKGAESKYENKLVIWEQATIQPWEGEMLKEHGRDQYDGSCFFRKVNDVVNGERGMSDLLQGADWIDMGEEVLFALGDREQFAGLFSWDVTLTGADDNKVQQRSNQIRNSPPKKGSVNIHNDSEVWEMVAPDLGQTGTVATFRTILGFILGSVGFPVYFFGFGDDANLAVGVVQANPTEKTLEHDQAMIKSLFTDMCQFAIDQSVIAGTTPDLDTEDYELVLNLPEISTKDITRITVSFGQLTQALVTVQEKGWLTEEKAVTILAKVIKELGVDIDPAEELKKAAAEREKRELDQEQQRSNALKTMMVNGQRPGNGQNGMNGQPADVVTRADMMRMFGVNGDE